MLKVGVQQRRAIALAPFVLTRFAQAYPNINLSFNDGAHDELVQMYQNDSVDMIIYIAREQMSERFLDIVKGAALIAGVAYEVEKGTTFFNKIPVLLLNDLLIDNAKLAGAPQLAPPREKTGSTDFGNVMYEIPGSCIRVAFVPEGTASHPQEYVDAGKSDAAHNCIIYGAKAIAGASYDLITTEGLMDKVKAEFAESKKKNA